MTATIDSIVERATKDPDFRKRLHEDPVRVTADEGYGVSLDDVREYFELHGTSDEELMEKLRERMSHALHQC